MTTSFTRWAASVATACLLSACAATAFDVGRTETVLPLNWAWVDGAKVEYVTTDVSDPAMAVALGVNYVPRLKDALGGPGQKSLVERVYMFPAGEQINVFQSAPRPTGGKNADAGYSPLWRAVGVQWLKPEAQRELKSEEAILRAADLGEVRLDVTQVVVNCPITRSIDKRALRGVR
ncbi:MAG: hypothetical protein U5M53_10735 [Rhodoferax sp.]|nr:hypothetical protein [Rhodoferax sp.]